MGFSAPQVDEESDARLCEVAVCLLGTTTHDLGCLACQTAPRGPAPPKDRRGYGAHYLDHVQQADQGCDFDFLRKLPNEPIQTDPLGLVGGAIGGW